MVKRINRKHMLLIILVAYVIAYLLIAGVENYRVKNEFELAKREYYYKEWLKMGMSRRGLDVILDKMVELMGAKDVLMELTNAMSTHELEDYLSFISRMNDMDLFMDEDEEDDY